MTHGPLIKIQAATAAEICAGMNLKKDAKPLLSENMSPQEFVAALVDHKKYLDAIDFMANALPAREGIWWGCLCMQHACGDALSPPERAAATAVVQWIMQPSDENGAAAKASATAAGPGSPAGILAMAASRAATPAGAAKSIASAVKLASTKAPPVKMAPTQRSYVELAIEIAEGRFI